MISLFERRSVRMKMTFHAHFASDVPSSTAVMREENWALIRILQLARLYLLQRLCNSVAESTISLRQSVSPLPAAAWPRSFQLTRWRVVHTGD